MFLAHQIAESLGVESVIEKACGEGAEQVVQCQSCRTCQPNTEKLRRGQDKT